MKNGGTEIADTGYEVSFGPSQDDGEYSGFFVYFSFRAVGGFSGSFVAFFGGHFHAGFRFGEEGNFLEGNGEDFCGFERRLCGSYFAGVGRNGFSHGLHSRYLA